MDRVKLNELNLLKALGLKKIDKTAPANVGYNFFDESRIELIGGRIVFETFDTKDKVIKSYKECPPLSYILNTKAQEFCNGKITCVNPSSNKEKRGEVGKQYTDLLKYPNPLQTDLHFRSQVSIYTQLFGYCPVLRVKPEGMSIVSQLWVLPPQCLRMKLTKTYLFAESIYDMIESVEFTYNGKITQIRKEDIYFFTDTTTTIDDLMFPMSRLSALKYPINNLIKNYESRGTIIEKRGALGILSPDSGDSAGAQRATPEQKEELQKDYKRYGLLKDQWQIIVSTISMKFTPMSLNMRDLMLIETAEDDIMTLCDALGFKYQLLSRGSGTTFNNQELAQKAQYQDNIIPMADNYMSQFNDCVYAEENNVKYIIDFSHVPCMQADEKLKSEIRKNNVSSLSLQLKNNLITYGRAMEILEEEAPTELAPLYFYQLPPEIQATFTNKTTTNETQATN